jgi:hypothetical protein
MTGTNCELLTHKESRSYLNHLVSTKLSHLYFVLVVSRHLGFLVVSSMAFPQEEFTEMSYQTFLKSSTHDY